MSVDVVAHYIRLLAACASDLDFGRVRCQFSSDSRLGLDDVMLLQGCFSILYDDFVLSASMGEL